MKLLCFILAFSTAFAEGQISNRRFPLVDLHTHVFMNDGMGIMFRGDFEDPLRSSSWKDRFSSQINESTLQNSNLGVVVVALYAIPVLSGGRRKAIRRQIQHAENFVKAHPEWIIAKTPEQTRNAHLSGKRVLILSLEGAAGILENEKDFREFIDEKGIRIVTFAHLTNDHLTGGALMKGYRRLSSPGEFVKSVFKPRFNNHGVRVNSKGLTNKGRWVVEQLIKRKVWIDLSHTTEAAQKDLLPILKSVGQPLLYTHTALQKYMPYERQTSIEQLTEVAKTGGIVGLLPSEEVLSKTKIQDETCPKECHGQCSGNVWALASQFNETAEIIGDQNVYLGTDFSGAMRHLPPIEQCKTNTPLDVRGLYNIGQTPILWAVLRQLSNHTHQTALNGALNFIETWARVYQL